VQVEQGPVDPQPHRTVIVVDGERAVLVRLGDRLTAHEGTTKTIGLQRAVTIGPENATPRIDSDGMYVLRAGDGKHDGAISAGDLDNLVSSDYPDGMHIIGAWRQVLLGTHRQNGQEQIHP